MRVYETHLVGESPRYTDEHVVNVGDDGTDTGKLLAVGEPEVYTNILFSNDFEVHVHVLEITCEGSARASNSYFTSLDLTGY